MKIALVGGVSSTWYTLDALIRAGVEVTGVLGVDESRAEARADLRSKPERRKSACARLFTS